MSRFFMVILVSFEILDVYLSFICYIWCDLFLIVRIFYGFILFVILLVLSILLIVYVVDCFFIVVWVVCKVLLGVCLSIYMLIMVLILCFEIVLLCKVLVLFDLKKFYGYVWRGDFCNVVVFTFILVKILYFRVIKNYFLL